MQASEDRPPYVRFEMRAVEDRAASEEAGHYVGKDVVFALITPMGSKDRIERVADEWIKYIGEQARDGRFNPEWVRQFKFGLEEFKEGREVPENGTPVLGWTILSPAQQEAVIHAGVRTVEDLAVANESAVMIMGIGGRQFKQKAEAWLATRDEGKSALEMDRLRSENEQLSQTVESLTAKVTEMAKNLEVLKKDK